MGLFVLVFSGLNLYLYFSGTLNNYTGISGEAVSDIPEKLNFSLIAFVGQWVLLLMIVMFAYSKFLKHKKAEDMVLKNQNFIIPTGKSETPLDAFYFLIKQKGILHTGVVATLFKISKETALDWAKMLEEEDLVTVEYPAFSEPEIRIKGYKKENYQDKTYKIGPKNK